MHKKDTFNKLVNYIIFFTIVSHAAFIGISPVNYEQLFVYASQYPEKISKEDLNLYFQYQANSIFFSYLINFFHALFPSFNPLIVAKTISLSGFLFFGLALRDLMIRYDLNNAVFFILIIFHPVIWNLGFRATPDFISFSTGFFGFVLFLKNLDKKLNLYHVLSSLFLALSLCLKIHSIFFIILIIFIFFFLKSESSKDYKKIFTILTLSSVLTISFYLINYIKFDFFILNDNFSKAHKISTDRFLFNLIGYLGYLCLLVFPIILIPAIKFKDAKMSLFIFLLFFFIGYFYLNLYGELNLGFFISLIPNEKILNGLVLLMFILFLFVSIRLFSYFKKVNKEILILLSLTIFFIFLLSFSRPANRYLIYAIPFIYLFCFIFQKSCNKKFVNFIVISSFIFGIILNYLILNNQIITAKNIDNIISYTKNNLKDDFIDYSTIFPHRPVFVKKNAISPSLLNAGQKYFEISENIDNSIYKSCKKLIFIIHDKCLSINVKYAK